MSKIGIYPFLKDFNIFFLDIIPIFVKNKKEMNGILIKIFSHYLFNKSSEIIIAGFDEITKTKSYICFRLIVKTKKEVIYDVVDLRINIQKPLILSFGDDGEVRMFLNGILPDLNSFILNLHDAGMDEYLYYFIQFISLNGNFDDDLILQLEGEVDNFKKYGGGMGIDFNYEIEQYKHKRHNPLFNLSNSLPKSYLAELIVFLINLTYYKRKFSLDVENVGGDISIVVMDVNGTEFIDSDN